ECVGVEQPSAHRNLDAKLVLLVAFTMELCKVRIIRLRILHQRARRCQQRRRLVEAAVKSTEDPVQARNADRSTYAGSDLALDQRPLEARISEASAQRQP